MPLVRISIAVVLTGAATLWADVLPSAPVAPAATIEADASAHVPPADDSAAATVASTPATEAAAPLPTLPPATEVTIDRRTQLGFGMGYAEPLGAAATLTLLHGLGADVDAREQPARVEAVCAAPTPYCARGFLAEVAAGPRGGRFSLGLGGRARIDADGFRGTVGVGLKLSVARTWRAAPGDDPDHTYAGPEIDFAIKHIGLGFGLLWRVSGSFSALPLFSWGLGIVI